MNLRGCFFFSSLLLLLASCAPSGGTLNPPINFSATSTSASSVNLTWSAVSGASGYTLERRQDQGSYAQVASPSSTSYSDASVSPNSNYTYRLKATQGNQISNAVEKSVITPTVSPSNFIVISATASSITLSWDPTPGATSYRLERADDSTLSNWSLRPLSATPPTSYTDSEVSASNSYAYRLSALNAGGASQAVTVTASNLQPSNFQASSDPNQLGTSRTVNLSWGAVSSASGYQIQRRTGSGAFADLTGATNLSSSSYADTSAATGTTYTYQIRALVSGGAGPWVLSNSVTTSGVLQAPGSPSGLSATASALPKQVALSWNAPNPNSATSYTVQRSLSGSTSFSTVGTATTTSYNDTSINWGTSYVYQVLAVNAAGNSPPSNSASATTLAAPGAPSNLSGSYDVNTPTTINLSWTAPSSGGPITGYQLQRRLYSSNDPGTFFNLTGTTFADTGLAQNTSYSYTLTAVNAAGSSAPISLVASTPSNSPNPTGLFAKPLSATSIQIVWQGLSNATNYSVERSSDGVNFTKISTDPLTNIFFTDPMVVAPGPYTYRVKAQISGSYGSGTTLLVNLVAPGAPGGVNASVEGEGNGTGSYTNQSWMGIRVTWNPATSGGPVSNYEVQRLAPGGSWNKVYPEDFDGVTNAAANPPSRDYYGNLPSTLYGDIGNQNAPLQAGSTYQFRVRSVNPFGVSGWSSTSSATLPQASAPRVVGCRSGSSNQSNLGCFGAVFDWPHVATHAALLSTGKVISFHSRDADGSASNPDPNNQTLHDHTLVTVWDPSTGSFSRADNPNTDLFCAGFVSGPDGKFYTTGGNLGDSQGNGSGYYAGSKHTDIFDPVAQTWSKGPDMADGRWYPSTITLNDGRLLTIGGNAASVPSGGAARLGNYIPEVWNTSSGSITQLTGASTNVSAFNNLGGFEHYYPWIHQAPNGYVFLAGSQMAMGYLNFGGSGNWTAVGQRDNVWRTYGTSVMFRPGEDAVFGGGLPSTNSVTLIQLQSSGNSITTRNGNSMSYSRTHLNATLLPDGNVFVNGGNTSGANYDPTPSNADPQRQSEIWSPPSPGWASRTSDGTATNNGGFSLGPTAQIRRFYHSVALLLPDGSVLTAGSGACGPCTGLNQLNAEIYYPYYLFNSDGSWATRPNITAAPSSIGYGSSFTVSTDQPSANIAQVTFIKLGAVTHAFNMGQTFSDLSFSAGAGANDLSITAPQSGNVAPPGYYLLFVLNGSGIPSVAKIVKIG